MSKNTKKNGCCAPSIPDLRVEAIVNVDERGQMVLPKEIRTKAGLAPGDKLAVVTRERDGKVCCIYLFKAEELMEMAKDRLGPLIENRVEAR